MRALLSVIGAIALLGGPAAARAADPPAPLHRIHVDEGFIDDVLALSEDGERLAYVHTDGEHPVIVIERLGSKAAVRIPLPDFGLSIARLRFSHDGRLLLVVGADRTSEAHFAQFFTVNGKPYHGRLGPAVDFALGTLDGAPVLTALEVKPGRKGNAFAFVARRLADLKVQKQRTYVQDAQGLLKGLDFRIVSYSGDYQRIIGQRKGEYDRKHDIRQPEQIAVVEALTGKLLSQTPIAEPIAWAEVTKLRTERPRTEAFIYIEELKTLVLVDRDQAKQEIKLATPMHRYEPKTLAQELHGDTIFFSLAIDPVNPDATSRGKTDRPDVDFYALDLGTRTARPLFRLRSDRPVSWTVGRTRIAVLRKYKNFSRGGRDLEVYPFAGR